MDDLTTAEREVQPDLLVVDANSWGRPPTPKVGSDRGPCSCRTASRCHRPTPPPSDPAFPAPRHWFDRARDRLVWAVQHATGRSTVKRLNVLRGEVGAAPVKTVSDLYQRSDVLLYRTAEPFEYPRRDWPANVRAIGPGLWAPPGEEPEWLADLPHPRTLVTVSTEFQDDGRIVRTALAALQDQPGSVIVTTAALDPDDFATSSERVHISRTLPHAVVIPEMDLVITHGGMGTVQRSLAAGVPYASSRGVVTRRVGPARPAGGCGNHAVPIAANSRTAPAGRRHRPHPGDRRAARGGRDSARPAELPRPSRSSKPRWPPTARRPSVPRADRVKNRAPRRGSRRSLP